MFPNSVKINPSKSRCSGFTLQTLSHLILPTIPEGKHYFYNIRFREEETEVCLYVSSNLLKIIDFVCDWVFTQSGIIYSS